MYTRPVMMFSDYTHTARSYQPGAGSPWKAAAWCGAQHLFSHRHEVLQLDVQLNSAVLLWPAV